MLSKFIDRAKMFVSGTPGTGSITLGGAVANYQTFSAAGALNGDQLSYVIEDGSNWEVGRGVYLSSGPTLARTNVLESSNSGALISASSSAIAYITAVATDLNSLASGFGISLTRLALTANLSCTQNVWNAISWPTSTPVEDPLGTFNTSTPMRINAPAGYNRVKITFHTTCVNTTTTGNYAIAVVTKNDGGTFPTPPSVNIIYATMFCTEFESGHTLVTQWLSVNPGDYFSVYYNPTSDAVTLAYNPATDFAAPTNIQFEWATTATLNYGGGQSFLTPLPAAFPTWANQNGATASNFSQYMQLQLTTGNSSSLTALLQPLAAAMSAAWVVTGVFSVDSVPQSYTRFGLVLSDGTKFREFFVTTAGPTVGSTSWTNTTTQNASDTPIAIPAWAKLVALRLLNDGTHLTLQMSVDGVNWTQVDQFSSTADYGTWTQVGVGGTTWVSSGSLYGASYPLFGYVWHYENVTGNSPRAISGLLVPTGAPVALTTPLPILQGGTGSTTAAAALTALGAASAGANSTITSLTGLTTPLSPAQGGTGVSNGTKTITLGGNLTTFGAFTTTLTATAATTATLPAGTTTLAAINLAQTWTAAQTFNSGYFVLAGSASGTTIVQPAAVASGTLTLPATTDTLVGRATTDTLTNKTLTSPVVSGGTINNAVLGGTTPAAASITSLNGAGLAGLRNRLMNGNFAINQRVYTTGTALAAATYAWDRWKTGASGGTATFTAATPDTTITITAGTFLQIVEAGNVEGGTYTLSWTGTATARVYQGSATGSYVASPLTLTGLTAGTATTVEFSTGTLVNAQFEPGSTATPFERRTLGVELMFCQRYFCKSYAQATPPGTASNVYGAPFKVNFNAYNSYTGWVFFPVTMRTTPTVTIYNHNTGASGTLYFGSAAASKATAASGQCEEGFETVGNGNWPPGGDYTYVHYTASADL